MSWWDNILSMIGLGSETSNPPKEGKQQELDLQTDTTSESESTTKKSKYVSIDTSDEEDSSLDAASLLKDKREREERDDRIFKADREKEMQRKAREEEFERQKKEKLELQLAAEDKARVEQRERVLAEKRFNDRIVKAAEYVENTVAGFFKGIANAVTGLAGGVMGGEKTKEEEDPLRLYSTPEEKTPETFEDDELNDDLADMGNINRDFEDLNKLSSNSTSTMITKIRETNQSNFTPPAINTTSMNSNDDALDSIRDRAKHIIERSFKEKFNITPKEQSTLKKIAAAENLDEIYELLNPQHKQEKKFNTDRIFNRKKIKFLFALKSALSKNEEDNTINFDNVNFKKNLSSKNKTKKLANLVPAQRPKSNKH